MHKKVIDIDIRQVPDKVALEAKYDGIWITVLKTPDGEVQIWSRGDKRKTSLELEYGKYFQHLQPGTFIFGEAEYGSQWGKDMLEKRGYNVLHLFDMIDGWNDNRSYQERKDRLFQFWVDGGSQTKIEIAKYKYIDKIQIEEAFNNLVAMGYEGVVIKFPIESRVDNETWMRMKADVTEDYVVMEILWSNSDWKCARTRGFQGKIMQALNGGQYLDGKLTKMVECGGGFNLELRLEISKNPESFIGKVFEVSAKKKFKSGSLRHPNFNRWREDKKPEECSICQASGRSGK